MHYHLLTIQLTDCALIGRVHYQVLTIKLTDCVVIGRVPGVDDCGVHQPDVSGWCFTQSFQILTWILIELLKQLYLYFQLPNCGPKYVLNVFKDMVDRNNVNFSPCVREAAKIKVLTAIKLEGGGG